MVENIIYSLEKIVWSVPLTMLLMFTHMYFTAKLRFPQRKILEGFKLMFKRDNTFGISSFKAVMTVLAGTLGVGNIVGVSTAITLGGIGSIFWIFVSGIFAMATKYTETYIPLKYREFKKGKYIGGAMYVLEKIGLKKLGISFSLFVIFSSFGGSMIQSNAMSEILSLNLNISKVAIAIIVTLFCFFVIFGNETRIAMVSSAIVPIAIVIYVYMCIYLCILFRNNILNSICLIIKEAFNFRSVCGGFFASSAIKGINVGMSKGLYSNEAGMGSSPLFNVSVNSKKSISDESLIASTSVFIDTVVLCTITGVLFVASGIYKIEDNPIELTNKVFSLVPYGKYLNIISLTIFAVSTLPCTGYYGSVGINYIFNGKKFYEVLYKLVYVICVFIGCLSKVTIVWAFSSIFNALMVLPNLVMLYSLKDEVK